MEIRALRASEMERPGSSIATPSTRAPPARAFLRRHDPARVIGAFAGGRLSPRPALPIGQFFGGRAVPMGGLASVAVVPDRRGEGLASRSAAARFAPCASAAK